MPIAANPQPPLADLIAELETAVRIGDRVRATQLEREILQRLATETADRAAIERQVRALLAELDRPKADTRLLGPEVLNLERGGPSPETAGAVYPVWFGTNRKPVGDGFTGERHDRTTFGRALVYVPEAHRFGETGTSFWRRLLRFDLRDDHLRLQGVETRERQAFFTEINEAMQAARESGERPHALFFLHGYNVSFEDAAIRAAQLGVDLKVPGATAFFSWPSRGSVAAYPADEATIEASEPAITDFLVDFTANCGAEKVHVIAHSMGNRGLLRALQRIAANVQTRGKVKFGQIFLAAPDDMARAMAEKAPMLELTYNWDEEDYGGARNFGHLAYLVDDIYAVCARLQAMGVTINRPPRDGHMAFVRSPDKVSIELLQKGDALAPQEPWASMANTGTW